MKDDLGTMTVTASGPIATGDQRPVGAASDREKLCEAMAAIEQGRPLPDGMLFHATKATTQADWDALDPNSYETECAKCGAYIVGRFGPNHETTTPCKECGATDYTGGIGSPAGAFSLAMHDPAFD